MPLALPAGAWRARPDPAPELDRRGARNLWTLSSELSWHRTQRLTGRLLALEGVALLISAFALGPVGRLSVLLAGLVVLLVVTATYSWWVWRRDPHKGPVGR